MVDKVTRHDALFVNLVMLFKEAALQQMGKLINPITGKVEKNLDQARFSIDTLDMLKAKTAGNLSVELQRLLDTTLIELRMNYIAEIEKEAKEKQNKSSSAEAGKNQNVEQQMVGNDDKDAETNSSISSEEGRDESSISDSSHASKSKQRSMGGDRKRRRS